MFEEKRQSIRVKKPLSVQFGIEKKDGSVSWDMSLIRDISETGICLRANTLMEKDTICHLKLKVPIRPSEALELIGKVVSSEESRTNVYEARLTFVGLNETQKEYLREYIAWVLVNERGEK